MRRAVLVGLPLLLMASACSSTSNPVATTTVTATVTATATATATVTATATPASGASGQTATCRTSQLSLRLGTSGSAAGSVYQPIVFTNRGAQACALTGYPGVAFVAPNTGHQVGAAATHSAQQPVTAIVLAPGSAASALLQIADYLNFPTANCQSQAVSGLRVYPPGNTSAAYLPFTSPARACSTQAGQLAVAAVVAGTTGQ